MAQAYADQQPQGYKNHVSNIALVGAGGQVGKHITASLLTAKAHNITAITRQDSTSTLPSGITVAKVDYSNPSTLVTALKNIDVLIITLAVTAPPDFQTKLIDAAAEANVPWVIPNEWGPDGANEQLGKDIMLGDKATKYRARIEELGKSSWIGICCSFWYEYSLSTGSEFFGFDFKNRKVVMVDDGNTRINTSTWEQCGRGIASLLSLKILPDDVSDTSAHLSQFRNRFVYWSSFLLSQHQMLESVCRVTNAKTDDWEIEYQPHQQRYESGVEELKKGNRMGFGRLLYTRVFFPNGDGDFEHKRGLQNGILGLPREALDECTKKAVQMAEERGALGGH